MARKTARKPADQFGPRVRFNWGFHDGRSDKASARPKREAGRTVPGTLGPLPAWDAAYQRGYAAGWEVPAELAGDRNLTSEAAWAEDQAILAAEAAERKRIREMRPEPFRRF